MSLRRSPATIVETVVGTGGPKPTASRPAVHGAATQISMASFAEHFRYELLQRFGGLWPDTDVIAVAGPASLPDAPFPKGGLMAALAERYL